MSLVDQVRRGGVVGAGGAGFPTYVKLATPVDTYICNAAECEPLLCKDQELMKAHAEQMVRGMRLAMDATGATRGIIAIKKKYTVAMAALKRHMGPEFSFYLYDNFYPAGDEYIIVYDVMGKRIPEGGLPKDVGCAVNNVETFINIANAVDGKPVTHTAMTVAGAVHRPISAMVPLGVTAREVLALAGGATVVDPVLIDGGPMMGKLVEDLDKPMTKTSGGFVVLARDHYLVKRRSRSDDANVRISKSACDQCMYCTEFCPRYLLGYAIEPHKVMRSVGFAGEKELGWAQMGLQCCECNLCSLYACPEDLPPMEMCIRSKGVWKQLDDQPPLLKGRGEVHPMRDSRRVSIPRLIRRLGLEDWDVHAPMVQEPMKPMRVKLMLSQHIGAPATPVVSVGDAVSVGQIVADVPAEKLGVPVHASIAGRVSRVDSDSITVER